MFLRRSIDAEWDWLSYRYLRKNRGYSERKIPFIRCWTKYSLLTNLYAPFFFVANKSFWHFVCLFVVSNDRSLVGVSSFNGYIYTSAISVAINHKSILKKSFKMKYCLFRWFQRKKVKNTSENKKINHSISRLFSYNCTSFVVLCKLNPFFLIFELIVFKNIIELNILNLLESMRVREWDFQFNI